MADIRTRMTDDDAQLSAYFENVRQSSNSMTTEPTPSEESPLYLLDCSFGQQFLRCQVRRIKDNLLPVGGFALTKVKDTHEEVCLNRVWYQDNRELVYAAALCATDYFGFTKLHKTVHLSIDNEYKVLEMLDWAWDRSIAVYPDDVDAKIVVDTREHRDQMIKFTDQFLRRYLIAHRSTDGIPMPSRWKEREIKEHKEEEGKSVH